MQPSSQATFSLTFSMDALPHLFHAKPPPQILFTPMPSPLPGCGSHPQTWQDSLSPSLLGNPYGPRVPAILGMGTTLRDATRRTSAITRSLPSHPGSALALPTLGAAGRETPFLCSEENESGRRLAARIGGPMAAPSPTAELPSEASCPICLEYFRDPVSIHCGHNFCRACITRCWEWSTVNFSCPQCRETAPERNFRPSRELARVLEIAKRLSLQAARGEVVEEEGCERHREPLKVFCKDDEAFICMICRESRAHRSHTMLPVQDAVQEYKVKGIFFPSRRALGARPAPSGLDVLLGAHYHQAVKHLTPTQGSRLGTEKLSPSGCLPLLFPQSKLAPFKMTAQTMHQCFCCLSSHRRT